MLHCIFNIEAAGYTTKQKRLRTEIFSFLEQKGYSPSEQTDGLKFKASGVTYYVEIDSTAINPMYVRLRRYVKFGDSFKRSDVSKNINDYNKKLGVKVFCLDKSIVLSVEMFVTEAKYFTYAFESLLSQLQSSYKELTK